jgi:hypothetical protein
VRKGTRGNNRMHLLKNKEELLIIFLGLIQALQEIRMSSLGFGYSTCGGTSKN